MNTHEGYSKKTISNANVLLAGGGDKSLADFIGGIQYVSASHKILIKTVAANASWTDLVTLVTTDENVKQTPKTDNVDRPLMMINGSTATNVVQTSTSMFATGIYANTKTNKITARGFIKTGSSSDYMLLGDGDHKSLDTFFYRRGFLYLNHDWDADTLKIGSWSFKSSGYGNVGSGAAHAHCLSENSIIEVFGNIQLSAAAWSDVIYYRVAWDSETNTNRPNRWSNWIALARVSDLPTKSSWDYDDVYSKLGHTHSYLEITGSGTTADMALVSTNTANTLAFKQLGTLAFDSTAYLPIAGGTMIGEEIISATSAIKLPLRSSHGTRATVYTSSSEGVIHGGEDNASYLGANVQIGTWYGFGIYNSNGGEKAGKNTFWHDARSGNTYTWGTYYKFAKVNGTDTYTEVSYNGHKHDADYVQSVSISGNNLRVTKNNSNSDLTIPYATSAGNADTVTRFKYLDNWNSSTQGDNKVYFISCTSPAATGAPGGCYSGVSFMTNYVGFQLCTYGGSSEDLNFRKYKDSNNGAAWTTWRTIYHSGNLPAYPTKDSWNYDDRYVTAVGNGTGDYVNNLYYTKNGSNSYFTVNYATNANTATHIKLTYINSSSNLNDIANGFYYHSDLNNPTNFVAYNSAFLQFSGRGGYDKFQLEFGANDARIFFRKASNNSFTSWLTIAWTSDIPTIPSTYDWSAITNKPETATRWPSWDEITSKPDIWSVVTITKTLKPTTSWLDTGIVTTDLGGEGLYVLTVKHPDSSDGYYPSHAGLMYNYTNYTNGSMGLEIPLHYGSHHLDYGRIFLRTLLTPNTNGKTKILIRSIANYSNSHTFTFKFRRII